MVEAGVRGADCSVESRMIQNGVVRVAAVGDIHYSKTSQGMLQAMFSELTDKADILLLAGDLTDFGLAEEARILAKDVSAALRIPAVAVLGNHDYEAGEEKEVSKILQDAGIRMLDGDIFECHGIGIAGVRGFCGGFGRGALGAWGEQVVKAFVHEAVSESLKLESALARLRSVPRVVLLHYAPIRDTVEGESLEVYPFLGSSRLEEPISRFDVTAVFHGHAHKGVPEGKTASGIPVYNVSMPLLKERQPNQVPYRILEISSAPSGDDSNGVTERRRSGRRSDDKVAAT